MCSEMYEKSRFFLDYNSSFLEYNNKSKNNTGQYKILVWGYVHGTGHWGGLARSGLLQRQITGNE